MAIIRRTERTAQPARTEWDPFRLMEQMMGWEPMRWWDPFRQMAPFAPEERMFVPSFEVRETKDGYLFKADLPGVKQNDVEISLTANQLTISGKREHETHEEGETMYAAERQYGAFTRTFTLPEAADAEHVKAEMKDGVLTLMLPKKPEMQPKKITIGTGAAKA